MSAVILPDHPMHDDVCLSLCEAARGKVLVRYPSGRPWIVGTQKTQGMIIASTPTLTGVAISGANINKQKLSEQIGSCSSIGSAERIAVDVTLSGGILVIRNENEMRIYGPPHLTRTVFWTRYKEVDVISDDQYVLAQLVEFEYDRQVLAARLTNLEVSHPFTNLPIWQGVHGVGPGQCLVIKRDTAPRPVKWWQYPDAKESIDHVAEELRGTIRTVVKSKVAGHRIISTDLSGGLDSTTLSFYASELGVPHYTLFLQAAESSNNDYKWASRAAHKISSRHLEVPYSDVVDPVSVETDISVNNYPEGPTPMSVSIATVPVLEQILAPTGSTIHLNGHGGDALFGEVSSLMWSLLRTSDPRRFSWLWKYRIMNRMPLTAMLRLLFPRRTFDQEIADLAERKFRSPNSDFVGYSDWIESPHFHPALTSLVKSEVSAIARRAADSNVCAIHQNRTTNQVLSYLAVHGTTLRRMNNIACGIQFESPYLDPRITDVALSLNIADRVMKRPIKPLLARARPPAMSIDYFERLDKGDYTAEMFTQYHQGHDRMRTLFADECILEEIGFIDRQKLLKSLNNYSLDGADYGELIELEFAERWLRSVKAARTAQLSGR